jgi:hypothetical protein
MADCDVGLRPGRPFFEWRALVKGTVGSMLVVVADIDRKDAFEVSSVHDQNPVETLATDGADPAFDEGVRAGVWGALTRFRLRRRACRP